MEADMLERARIIVQPRAGEGGEVVVADDLMQSPVRRREREQRAQAAVAQDMAQDFIGQALQERELHPMQSKNERELDKSRRRVAKVALARDSYALAPAQQRRHIAVGRSSRS